MIKFGSFLSLPPTRQYLTQGQMIWRSDYGWGLGRGRSYPSQGSSPVWLYWSSAHLMQCGSDEPSWTWTWTWVQAWMFDYSLNWTVMSTAILRWQRCKWCSSPSWSQGSFGLKSAFAGLCCVWPNARHSSKKAGLGQSQQQINTISFIPGAKAMIKFCI